MSTIIIPALPEPPKGYWWDYKWRERLDGKASLYLLLRRKNWLGIKVTAQREYIGNTEGLFYAVQRDAESMIRAETEPRIPEVRFKEENYNAD